MASPVHTYFYSMVEIGVVKFFVDNGIYRAIPHEENASVSYRELASKVGVQLNLLERFLNFLIAANALSAPTFGHVAHTASSRIFLREDASRFYQHVFDFFLVSAAHWPEYFNTHGPMEPKYAKRAPYGLAAGSPNKTLYEILDTMPQKAAAFNATMALAIAEMPATGTYDFGWITKHVYNSEDSTGGDDRVVLVDVGGGKGQILKSILEQNAIIPPNRCVLEDQSDEAVHADTTGVMSAVRRHVTSFFEEQPVKGALVYQVRRVLNDWPDEACVTILGQLREACSPDSRVLVAENLVSDKASVSVGHCAIDLFMMNFGGKRRTEDAYTRLAERAGFQVSAVARDKMSDFAVIEMLPIEAP